MYIDIYVCIYIYISMCVYIYTHTGGSANDSSSTARKSAIVRRELPRQRIQTTPSLCGHQRYFFLVVYISILLATILCIRTY